MEKRINYIINRFALNGIDIDVDTVYSDLEGAKSRLFKLNDPRYTIFQKFFRTFDF